MRLESLSTYTCCTHIGTINAKLFQHMTSIRNYFLFMKASSFLEIGPFPIPNNPLSFKFCFDCISPHCSIIPYLSLFLYPLSLGVHPFKFSLKFYVYLLGTHLLFFIFTIHPLFIFCLCLFLHFRPTVPLCIFCSF